jgi:hypothetical protein
VIPGRRARLGLDEAVVEHVNGDHAGRNAKIAASSPSRVRDRARRCVAVAA